MAYGRRTSIIVRVLEGSAWLCERWLLVLIVVILVSPVQPAILIDGSSSHCSYIWRYGTFATERPSDPNCRIIRFVRH